MWPLSTVVVCGASCTGPVMADLPAFPGGFVVVFLFPASLLLRAALDFDDQIYCRNCISCSCVFLLTTCPLALPPAWFLVQQAHDIGLLGGPFAGSGREEALDGMFDASQSRSSQPAPTSCSFRFMESSRS